MQLIDGRKIADSILIQLKEEISRNKIKVGLGVILVGDDPASCLYVRLKRKAAEQIGVTVKECVMPDNSSRSEIVTAVKKFNSDASIHGILVQFPLPKHVSDDKVTGAITRAKDVDGFLPSSDFDPPFIMAMWEALKFTKVKFENKKIVALVNSDIFGENLLRFFKKQHLNLAYSKSRHKDREILKDANVIITAIGRANYLKGGMIKDQVVLIDGGISKKGNLIVGDIDRQSVVGKALWLSPVPGGIGPVTVAMLLKNVVRAAKTKEL